MALIDEVVRGAYQLDVFSSEDIGHAKRIIERYADLRIGLADASVVVLANRHRTLELLCTDERHFRCSEAQAVSRSGCFRSTRERDGSVSARPWHSQRAWVFKGKHARGAIVFANNLVPRSGEIALR